MGQKSRGLIRLGPMFVLYTFFIIGGIVNIGIESLGYIPNLGFLDVHFGYYAEILMGPGMFGNTLYSLFIALVSATLSIIIGVVVAFWLVRTSQHSIRRVATGFLSIGVILPYLYMVFLVIVTFTRSGILSRWLNAAGVIGGIDGMPSLVYGNYGIGIIITFVLKGFPFVALMAMNVMSGINDNYSDVASTLGCSERKLLQRIYLPLSSDVVIWSGAVLFTYQMGAFEVPYLLGQLKTRTLSSLLYSSYISPDIRHIPITAAMTIILFLISLIAICVYAFVLRGIIRRWHHS